MKIAAAIIIYQLVFIAIQYLVYHINGKKGIGDILCVDPTLFINQNAWVSFHSSSNHTGALFSIFLLRNVKRKTHK